MKDVSRDRLVVKRYRAGLSAAAVGKELGISMWTVYKILKRTDTPRRESSETNRINFLAEPKSFVVPKKLSDKQRKLWQAGLLLYLGEGSKRNSSTVDLANADLRVLQIFLKMLREIYRVDEGRIRILIYCHSNKNPKHLISYWSDKLNIPQDQFTKPYVKAGFKGEESDKMKYGLVHVRYSDTRLWTQVMNDLHFLIVGLLG